MVLVFQPTLVSGWLLKDWMERFVWKLSPETLVEAPLLLCILDSQESSRLRVDSFLIWDSLEGLLLNFLLFISYMPDGWLSLRSLWAAGNNLTLFLNVLWEQFSLMVDLLHWETRVSRQSMDCTLNNCTDLSSILRLSVIVISFRGRQYLRVLCDSAMTTPQRLGAKLVMMKFLARKMAISMNCLCISFTVCELFSVKESYREYGTYWQKVSIALSLSQILLRFMVFLWEILFSFQTFASSYSYSSSLRKEYLFLTRIFRYQDSQLNNPKGNRPSFISNAFLSAMRFFSPILNQYQLNRSSDRNRSKGNLILSTNPRFIEAEWIGHKQKEVNHRFHGALRHKQRQALIKQYYFLKLEGKMFLIQTMYNVC